MTDVNDVNLDCDKFYTLELELVNGVRVIRRFNRRKIYDIKEVKHNKIVFSKSFPFVHLEKETCTKFRYQSKYETMHDFADARYCIRCNMFAFLDMIGLGNIVSWDENMLKHNIRHGQ